MKPMIVVVITVVVGGLAFFGGIQYQKSQETSGRNFTSGQGFGRTGQTGTTGMRRMGNGQPIAGEVLSVDSSTLTVKLADGSSKIILLSEKTVFNKTASIDKSELKVGEKVGVFGTSNPDGSVTAQNVQLNPQFRIGGNGRTATGSAR